MAPALQTLGEYEVLRVLGRGGMAEVLLARRAGADGFVREVVIKRILPDLATEREFVDLFRDEARITAQLRHGNIVQVLEFRQEAGQYAIVLEYVDGVSLAVLADAARQEGRPLPYPAIAYVLSEVARALDYAHRKRASDGSPLRVIHRDISPANILISRDGEVKLADFGIARAASRLSATSGAIRGKLSYIAPEALEGAPVQASDLFSLGMVGWELCVQAPALPADGLEARMRRILTETVPRVTERAPSTPAELADAIEHLVAREIAERPARAIAITHALAPLIRGFPVADQLAHRVLALESGGATETGPGDAATQIARHVPKPMTRPVERARETTGETPKAVDRNAKTPARPRRSEAPAPPPPYVAPESGEREPAEREQPLSATGEHPTRDARSTSTTGAGEAMPTNLEPLAARGATNLARHCLEVLHSERVCLFRYQAGSTGRLIEKALLDAGAELKVIDITTAQLADCTLDWVAGQLARHTASVAAAAEMPPALSVAIVRAVALAGVRHIHMPHADHRLLAASVRADPQVISRLNEYVVERLSIARSLKVETGQGAELLVRTSKTHPLVSDCGRPAQGSWDNLPSGFVFFHPGSIQGELVVDRIVDGPDLRLDPKALRKTPLEVSFRRGAVSAVRCADAAIEDQVKAYLDHHPDAPRVGFVSLPTNYLTIAEIGHPTHDALLPGVRIQLGFSDAARTQAPFDLDHGLRMAARRTTVTAGEEILVWNGRFAGGLAKVAAGWA